MWVVKHNLQWMIQHSNWVYPGWVCRETGKPIRTEDVREIRTLRANDGALVMVQQFTCPEHGTHGVPMLIQPSDLEDVSGFQQGQPAELQQA